MARYAIGDLQGCFDALQNLLKKVAFNWQKDELWLVGDIINRGPKSLDTLRYLFANQSRVKMVLGNHDLHFLAVYYGLKSPVISDTLDEILAAPDVAELVEWLRFQPLMIWEQQDSFAMVHAGIPPIWSLAQTQGLAREVEQQLQSSDVALYLAQMYGNEPRVWRDDLTGGARLRCITNYFTRMRFCAADGELDLLTKESADGAPEGFAPWFSYPAKNPDTKIIFGHWAALNGKSSSPHAIALDTGCVWGGSLTAYEIDGDKYIACDCPENNRLTEFFVTKRHEGHSPSQE